MGRLNMKVLVISDVHANIHALEAVSAAEPDAELVLFAGDMVDFGYFPHEVIKWFRSRKCICVMGNHDREIVNLFRSGYAGIGTGKVPNYAQYNLMHMTKEDVEYLAALPEEVRFEIDGISYYMAHYYGSDTLENEEYFERQYLQHEFIASFEKLWREKMPEYKTKKRRVILGHSHRSITLRRGGEDMLLNPGAVGYQLGPDCLFAHGADYMVIENGEVMSRHVEYDGAVIRQFVESVPLQESALGTAEAIFHTILFPERRKNEMDAHLKELFIL